MAIPASTTRRDFLRGGRIAEAIAGAVGELHDQSGGAASAVAPGSDSVIAVSRRAMACQFQVILPATCPDAVSAAPAALDQIDRLEDQMTVYRDTSEVSQINTLGAAMPLPVEERLFGLLQMALRLTDQTGGAFDMAAGALVKCWGFFRGPRRAPSPAELKEVMKCTGSRHLVLDAERRAISFRRPGVELNLGAIGKGYALDRAAELLRRDWDVGSALLHGGRSSVYALGTTGGEGQDPAGWLVGIAHPTRPDQRIGTVRLCNCALGTSGATFQFFEADGRQFGHILDPRTGWPAEPHACVSVIAPTAAEADALSTALYIMGPEKARAYVASHQEIGAVLVMARQPDGPLDVDLLGRAAGLVQLETIADGGLGADLQTGPVC